MFILFLESIISKSEIKPKPGDELLSLEKSNYKH